jgi:hypothetical protein
MAVNKKKTVTRKIKKELETAHTNFMGAPSYDISSPLLRLMCISASSFFGEPMYYKGQASGKRKGTGKLFVPLSNAERERLRKELNAIDDYRWRNMTPKEAMESAIKESLLSDPVATLKWASTLRNEENIRVTPQIILVVAANMKELKGSGLIRQFAPTIIGRADEVSTQLAYQLDNFGKPVPNSLRRAWKDYLSKATEYQLAKYRMENREVKTVDVANLAMGTGFYGYDTPIGKLMRGELSLGGDIKTWESIISAGGKWDDAVEVMGHMALLRNIRNLVEHKVPTSKWLDKLVETAKTGRQLPFRYFSAYMANKGAPVKVLDAIETCLELSIGNLPRLKGKSLILTDNSGSARGTCTSELGTVSYAQIGNLMGVLTGKVSEEGLVGTFGDRLACIEISKKHPILSQMEQIDKIGKTVGLATENGIWLALDKAIKHKEHWDNIFIYSDMQAGHGGLYGGGVIGSDYCWRKGPHSLALGAMSYIDVPKLVRKYRNTVNPKVNVFLVQIAGYEDTIIPEFYNRTYIIGGWSGSVLKFARRMIDTIDEFESANLIKGNG